MRSPLLLAATTLLLTLASSAWAQPAGFVVINLDDTRADGLDLMPVLQARLAGEGVSFENSFVPSPICCPSRASLLSGLYAVRHGTQQIAGVIGGADTFRERGGDRQTMGVWLDAAGYRTGFFGKYLNAYSEPTEGARGPNRSFYVPPGWDRWWAVLAVVHYGGVHGASYEVVEEDGSRTLFDEHGDDSQYLTDYSGQLVRSFISDAVGAGEPFLAVWAPYASHGETPTFVPAPADRHFDAFAGLPVWRPTSWNEADVSDKPRWVGAALNDAAVQTLTDVIRQRAYESLLAVDEQLEALLDHLVALGIDDDTVVILTSDNGAAWGEHRGFAQKKNCPYEECLRVPMIVRYPAGLGTTPTTETAPVLNLDVGATIAGAAGAAVPAGIDGASFAGWLTGSPPASWRSDFLIEQRRMERGDSVFWSGQVTDGDRLTLFHGDPRAEPRAATAFEFDDGGGVSPGAVAVPMGVDAFASFSNLGDAVEANVPDTYALVQAFASFLVVGDASPDHDGVYWWEELDQGGVFEPLSAIPDFFGVRDVANGYTWVEYETGERELYDLAVDPHQLENKADDPAYAAVRQQLETRLDQLLPPALGPVCSDGLDNDADGLVDHPADPGCASPQSNLENPRCDNDQDDDADGMVDWNGGPQPGPPDPHCIAFPSSDKEKASKKKGCGLGFEPVLLLAAARWARRKALRARRARLQST